MQLLWKTARRFLKKLKIELSYNPAIPLLGIYPDKTIRVFKKIRVAQCSLQHYLQHPRYWSNLNILLQGILPTQESKGRQILYHWVTCLRRKTEWNNAIWGNRDRPRDCHTKWSKSDRKRQISYDITYMWNLTYDTMNLFMKWKQTHRLRKQTYRSPKGKEAGGEIN